MDLRLPRTLTTGQNVEIVFDYENAVNATASFAGNVEYVTDGTTDGAGTWREFAFNGSGADNLPSPAQANGVVPASVGSWLMFE